MAYGNTSGRSNNSGRGGAGRGYGKNKEFRGGKPAGGKGGFKGKSSRGAKPGTPGGPRKAGTGKGPKFRSGQPFAQEMGEFRPNNRGTKNFGPHRPRRPKNAPVDHYDFYDHDGVRLQKLMASAGVASRRVCEEMIEEGRVTVNDQLVTELGVR
ncbi:MAG: S4 domain-containing protein, partial [Rothia sp. (in: high G+C Gram-positive bacteria)]|nr:S4 domain-containing protein [Rothia sp. (in: high G+C Gram-positive bacteria)]